MTFSDRSEPNTFSALMLSATACTHGWYVCATVARAERTLLHVGDDADDAHPGAVVPCAAPRDALADRVQTRPELPGHRLVDDDDRFGLRAVLLRRGTARAEARCPSRRSSAPNSQSCAMTCGRSADAGGCASMVNARRSRTESGRSVRCGGCHHARQPIDAFENLLIEGPDVAAPCDTRSRAGWSTASGPVRRGSLGRPPSSA